MYYLSEQVRENLMMRPTECCNDRSSIEEKIQRAHDIFATYGNSLRHDACIQDLLEKLQQRIMSSREVMIESGISEACKHCDEEQGGSCCGAGLENKFDVLLLLINILLGVPLPVEHNRPESCYLLTERGCVLKARLVLCVDYLCPKIMERLRHDELVRLQEISGDELTTVFTLYDAIKRFMRKSRNGVLV